MAELAHMMNLGPVIEEQLFAVGINTPEQLQQVGSRQAWLMIQKIDASACIHRLYAMEAAILGIKKKELSIEVKKELKAFYNQHKISGSV